MSANKYICRICQSAGNHQTYPAREMMFGTRETYEYFLCKECGCLQIGEIPSDIGRFYPPTYYSFNSPSRTTQQKPVLRQILERWRVGNAIFGRGHKLAKLAANLVDFPPQLKTSGPWLQKCNIRSFSARFLDVGCGSSSWWLKDLKALGFRHLSGVDPYIQQDVDEDGIHILRRQIRDVSGKYDLVTLHHSLEHIPHQLETLEAVRAVLEPSGFCLIRIPLVSSAVWGKYGTDWVELDAPRHLYLHSLESIEQLGTQAGFKLVHHCWDSTEFEFWGSEQYHRGIPLMADESLMHGSDKSNFTLLEMAKFRELANEANHAGKGGRGCFFFQVAT